MKKITNPKLNMFMEFFRAQGVKFVDMKDGKEIVPNDNAEDKK